MQIKVALTFAIGVFFSHFAAAVAATEFKPEGPFTPEQSRILKEWSAIWKSNDPQSGLQKFKAKHGLLLITHKQIGAISLLHGEGPCDNTYFSLVKDAKDLIEKIWEIDAKGNILRDWNPGTFEVAGIEGNKLYSPSQVYESIPDFSFYARSPKAVTHDITIAICADDSIELMPANFKVQNKWETTDIKCPPLKIDSEFKYCVKEKKTGRLFVLEQPCT